MGDIRNFGRAFFASWFTLMSGPVGVPLSVIGVFVSEAAGGPPWVKGTFWLTAIVCVLISCFLVWRAEHLKVINLEERTKPQLKCSFDGNDPGCIRRDTVMTVPVRVMQEVQHTRIKCDYYRIRVDSANSGNVSGCRGRLVSIFRERTPIFDGESATLTFAPAHEADTINKTIHGGEPEYLDLMCITENNQVIVTTQGFVIPSSVDMSQISRPGDYTIVVSVTSPVAVSQRITLLLKWGGDRKTAQVSRVPG